MGGSGPCPKVKYNLAFSVTETNHGKPQSVKPIRVCVDESVALITSGPFGQSRRKRLVASPNFELKFSVGALMWSAKNGISSFSRMCPLLTPQNVSSDVQTL